VTISLEGSYARCNELNKRYGTTYYWSTRVLPRIKQHHVHALYAFCRYADDIVDDVERNWGADPDGARAEALAAFGARFFDDLAAGRSEDPVLKAVVHTVKAFDIDVSCFSRFLRSMTMDLTIDRYETWDDLLAYMDGSAAVIGEMMLPILEPLAPEALAHARDLGNAFQLTNFLRDIDEDLDRRRQYVPQEDLRKFGVDLEDRRCTPEFVDLMQFEIARCRELYRSADFGLSLLPPRSARCIDAARILYSRILDKIEELHYDVYSGRARVPTAEKAALVARSMLPLRP